LERGEERVWNSCRGSSEFALQGTAPNEQEGGPLWGGLAKGIQKVERSLLRLKLPGEQNDLTIPLDTEFLPPSDCCWLGLSAFAPESGIIHGMWAKEQVVVGYAMNSVVLPVSLTDVQEG
jgi:hypothetical protein